MKPKYSNGDKVFAKVRGYPFWPARIVGVNDDRNLSVNKIKYNIVFYGTDEKAVVKGEDIHFFVEKRLELGKPRKHKAFNDAVAEIESELSPEELSEMHSNIKDSTDLSSASGDNSTPDRRSSVGRPRKQYTPDESPVNTSQPLNETAIYNETMQTKSSRGRKRKSKVTDSEELENTVDTTNPSPSSSNGTSRSGRKIKSTKVSQDEYTCQPKSSRLTSALKTKQTETNNSTEDVLSFTHQDKTILIPLNLNRVHFKSPISSADWNKVIYDEAQNLKEKILTNEILPEEAIKKMEDFTKQKVVEKKMEYEENDNAFRILKIEGRLLQLDVKIKSSLSLSKANPDECMKHLNELLTLPITALMLKKHPELIETYKRLRRYIGNTGAWNMTDEQLREFNIQAHNIRTKADHIFNKMKGLFVVPEGSSFTSVFSNELRNFNKATTKLCPDDFFSIVKEPHCGPD